MRTADLRWVAFFLVACGGGAPPPVEHAQTPDQGTGDSNADQIVRVGNGEGSDVCSLETVYFGYDAVALDAASRTAIDRAVQCWRDRGVPASLRLTGATDPNGTNEYNMALGERRAQAVRSYLVNLGIEATNISTMSMGEEEATGEDEAGWARDRHVRNTTQ